jgi:hypothetical protein
MVTIGVMVVLLVAGLLGYFMGLNLHQATQTTQPTSRAVVSGSRIRPYGGRQEIARRQKQIARGILHVSR